MDFQFSCRQSRRCLRIDDCITSDNQEVEKKARKQFKGLFDKKPGEIAEVGTVDRDLDQVSGENPEKGFENDPDGDNEEQHHEAEAEAAPPRLSFFSLLWPTGKRLFRALGVDRCSIL